MQGKAGELAEAEAGLVSQQLPLLRSAALHCTRLQTAVRVPWASVCVCARFFVGVILHEHVGYNPQSPVSLMFYYYPFLSELLSCCFVR